MKALLIFYSRTGTTRKVAQAIHSIIKCEVEEVKDLKNREGMMGYLKGGRDAMQRKPTKISTATKDPAKYDITIIGTPVWANNMAPAIRTYLFKNSEEFNKVAFFSTMGGSGSKKTFKEMAKLCEKRPIAMLELKTKEVISTDITPKIKEFLQKIKNS